MCFLNSLPTKQPSNGSTISFFCNTGHIAIETIKNSINSSQDNLRTYVHQEEPILGVNSGRKDDLLKLAELRGILLYDYYQEFGQWPVRCYLNEAL